MSTGATFLVGLGGVVAAVVIALLGAALLGSAGALLAIPGAILVAVLLRGRARAQRVGRPASALKPPDRA